MPDIPGNSSTTATITIGGTANDVLEVNGDHDWFRITLTAGQKITITVDGLTLEDSLVRILNSGGSVLGENDDISPGVLRDSRLVFTAPSSGTYYIDVGAFDDAYSGTYQLAVNLFTPPSVATIDTIAEHLTDGYWGGDSHHFNVTQGGTITVNVTALTAAGRTLARDALALWSDIIGVTFTEVTSGGQIFFDDNEEGAFTEGTWSNGITTSEHVNISTEWLATYGTGPNSYSFQTYVHEIGHALGLGHGGYYNTTATYPDDALFANDGWPTTVMSYFDQVDNTYFANQGYTFGFLRTPMVADIRAMADLYGLSTTTRTGDTTYGFGNNSGRAVYSANLGIIAYYAVVDSGGIDTLNYSGFDANQTINLNSETFSSIGGGVGNVSIGLGTVIENAIGGSGDDAIVGNSVANVLTGGGGNDTLQGNDGDDTLIGGFGNDTLQAGNGVDTVSYATAVNGGVVVNLATGIGTFNGASDAAIVGTDTLSSVENIIGSNFADLLTGDGSANNIDGGSGNDALNGGGGDDQLNGGAGTDTLTGGSGADAFRSTAAGLSGDTIVDLQAGDAIIFTDATLGGFTFNLSGSTLTYTGGSLTLQGGIAGTLVASLAPGGGVQLKIQTSVPVNDVRNDFNGDGRSDILWRSDSGQLSDWLANANGNGGFVANDANAFTTVPTNWHIVGTGDFNGDTRDDILWRNDAGQVSNWLGAANGGFTTNDANALSSVPTNWHVVGTGDFNGDGRDDILWRNDAGQVSDWLGTASGGFTTNDANALSSVPTNWHVAGTGDFNGDGRDDILWRNDAGQLSDWLGTASGGFVTNDSNAFSSAAPTNWHVVGTGDFNGDNRDDILWRSDTGQLSNWLGQANGGFVSNDANAFTTVPTNWTVVSVGDFNGDNRDDILWRSDTGQLSNWLGTATGGFTNNDANAFSSAAPTTWHVQPEHFVL